MCSGRIPSCGSTFFLDAREEDQGLWCAVCLGWDGRDTQILALSACGKFTEMKPHGRGGAVPLFAPIITIRLSPCYLDGVPHGNSGVKPEPEDGRGRQELTSQGLWAQAQWSLDLI